MSTQRKVYYRLVTRDGQAYAGTNTDFVMCSSDDDLMDLVNKVHSKNSAILRWCTPAQLKVHIDSASLNITNGALKKESALGESNGNINAHPLLVMVRSDGSECKRQRVVAPTSRFDVPKLADTFNPDGNIPRLNIPGLHGFITVPRRFLAGSGIGREDDDTHLFIRQSFLGQIDFIRNRVVFGGKCGYIYGMPGSGKSVCTYLFASRLAADWTVIWIHSQFFAKNIDNRCLCVRMSGTRLIDRRKHRRVSPTLNDKSLQFILCTKLIPLKS